MNSPRSLPVVVPFILSLVVLLVLLVAWVVYVVRSVSRIEQLAGRVGVTQVGNVHWIALAAGCALLALLAAGIIYQLAQSLATRSYVRKQNEFISNVTHELKSPLAAIRLHAQTLEQPGLDDADRRRSTRFILQQAERMGTLVDDVLESSRLTSRKKHLDLEPLPLEPFLERYLEEEGPRVEARGVRLTARLESAATVYADDEALRRVLDNLLDNAARFSDPGGEVRLHVWDDGFDAVLEVDDDGLGIPGSELKRIFDRFYQVRRGGGRRPDGSGLGLAIVYGLVQEMHGEIHAHSHEGRPGARFEVRLPAMADGAGAA